MEDAETSFQELTKHIAALEEKFLREFLPMATAKPHEYDLNVRAYCVLSHAALEEYIEKVALYVMTQSIDDFIATQKCRDTLLTLSTYYGLKLRVDEDESAHETKTYDYIRPLLEVVRDRFSKSIHFNQGVSIKYIRRLMSPVAIDIQQDANLKNSLMQLTKERGTFAHKRVATRILAPEDAKNYVDDCLKLCEDIKEKTTQKFL
jgi:hypothetical protein